MCDQDWKAKAEALQHVLTDLAIEEGLNNECEYGADCLDRPIMVVYDDGDEGVEIECDDCPVCDWREVIRSCHED